MEIRKRDGTVVDFDASRISNAVFKASQSIGISNLELAQELAEKVVDYLELMELDIPDIEIVQDLIEKVLIEEGHVQLAKEFIIYRYRRTLVRENSSVNNCKIVDKLLNKDVYLSAQAIHVLNNSDQLNALGQLIFLDRYSLKTKKEEIRVGDLVIVITKEDTKYPKKELGILISKEKDVGNFYLLHLDKEFSQSIWKVDKPNESILDSFKRVARAASSIEKDEEKEKWLE